MGQAGRDFGEFAAKLEKHLERLPDYAQRAQEKLQKYVPPEARANPLRRPAPVRPSAITDVPVIAEARTRWAEWNAPAARLERRKRRASRAMTLWIILTLLFSLYAVAAGLGLIGAGGVTEAVGGIAGAIVFGTLGVRSGMRLRQLSRTEVPVSTTPPPLPRPASAARVPMERLAESEASLAELLRQLSAPISMVPDESVDEARTTAAEAASALRALAGRIQAIERARGSAPAGERKALDAAIRTLREQLDDGLDSYGALVAAAGHAVAAGGSGLRQDALTDATDRLAGLAIALREVS
ncbi:phage shock envelope stress response protein PspM [Amycolatopsis pithecellobii]|uniref:Uncharacterized protein n=1 Tax=Amycolatopsis pithecellobii TaxID=664692 RepID=A0A6N7YZ09_9PSEU|nr:hypothetical protein [Amycolatopsis pithecellobii]MTD54133.1 hypothetical protein [Amycolatopsis pithecellobii]